MDVRKMITELRAERAEIERAINALQKVGGKRRSRPPKTADARAQRKKSKDEPPEWGLRARYSHRRSVAGDNPRSTIQVQRHIPGRIR